VGARAPVSRRNPVRFTLVALIAALAVQACKVEAKPQPTHRGIFVGGSDVFLPCGVDSLYRVEGRAKAGLEASYGQIARRPSQAIYVELKAQILPRGNQPPTDGFAGSIRIDTVLTATDQMPLECRPKVRPIGD